MQTRVGAGAGDGMSGGGGGWYLPARHPEQQLRREPRGATTKGIDRQGTRREGRFHDCNGSGSDLLMGRGLQGAQSWPPGLEKPPPGKPVNTAQGTEGCQKTNRRRCALSRPESLVSIAPPVVHVAQSWACCSMRAVL